MKPYYQDSHVTLYNGNNIDVLKELSENSVQCCVTSPPYWGLRKYAGNQDLIWGGFQNHHEHEWGEVIREVGRNDGGRDIGGRGGNYQGDGPHKQSVNTHTCSICGAWRGSYGLEPTPELYVQHTVEILREIRRVLRTDGVVFLNIGDSYYSSPSNQQGKGNPESGVGVRGCQEVGRITLPRHSTLKPKDLCLIPFRVAIAAQEDGWWVRSVIIWNKPNPMPESVKDRPTESHEYILMLTKSVKYYWDMEAVREPYTEPLNRWGGNDVRNSSHKYIDTFEQGGDNGGIGAIGKTSMLRAGALTRPDENGRNIRSVWDFPTQPNSQIWKTYQLSRVAKDVVSDGMMHIVSPSCPIHGEMFGQVATQFCGGHEDASLNHRQHTCARPLSSQSPDYASIDQNREQGLQEQNLGLHQELYLPFAIDHNNENCKTGHVPETNSPYMLYAETISHIDDKQELLSLFEMLYYKHGNNIWPDEMDVHLQDRIPHRIVDKFSLSIPLNCICSFYHNTTKKTSHFATFPEKLPETCIKASTKEDDIVLDPFSGSGTTLWVAKKLNRHAIGIDTAQEYCDLAIKRNKQQVLL